MENTQPGIYGQDNHNVNLSQDLNNPVQSDLERVFPSSEFYDADGNYKIETFESLGSLHYMNYLHTHDDML